ncbi:MAG: poly-beta-1,6 N-acetyl-D-glucosamine export porin PgaA [Ectothiorhodospiraceae bacterium]|nr:poly-beta-1,6 N-acetyl-D-glucosamine export porin PgaA [Ectothiorhodospiraceae bacterium]
MRGALIVAAALALGPVWAAGQGDLGTVAERHTRAVALARDGAHEEALAQLRALRVEAPDDLGILRDTVVVLGWAGRDAEAVGLGVALDLDRTPPWVLVGLAASAQRAGDRDLAVRAYRQILAEDPASSEALVGLARTHAEGGDLAAARAVLAGGAERRAGDAVFATAAGDLLAESGARLEATRWYTRALEAEPMHLAAARGLIVAALDLGAPHLAASLAERHPQAVDDALGRRIAADRAALAVRWGALAPAPGAGRFEATDRALAALDAVADASSLDLDDPLHRRVAFDRMVALRDRVRMAEVVALHVRLEDAGVEPPGYALRAVADARLWLREPEAALALYDAVLALDPDDLDAALGRFYALVEVERHAEALRAIDRLVESEPAWRRGTDPRVAKPNPRRLLVETTAAMARAFADDLAQAEQRLAALVARAPADIGLRQELATVQRWRGWPRRATTEHGLALALEPELVGARIGRAHAALDHARWDVARDDTARLLASHPENRHVQGLGRRLALHRSPALDFRFSTGTSSGGTAQGSRHLRLDTELRSAPWDDRVRAVVTHRFEQAVFTEGDGRNHRLGVGLEGRDGDVSARALLVGGVADHTELGLVLGLDLALDDHWALAAGLETSSDEVSLRGLRAGVRGRRVSGAVAHTWHESQRARLDVERMDFDDGNVRHAIGLAAERRVLTRPAWKATLEASAHASTNRRDDVAYFSPRADLSLDLRLRNEWRIARRYERDFRHGLEVGIGRYAQRGFGPGDTWFLRYHHEWDIDDALSLRLGVVRARRVYDGVAERETVLEGGLSARF